MNLANPNINLSTVKALIKALQRSKRQETNFSCSNAGALWWQDSSGMPRSRRAPPPCFNSHSVASSQATPRFYLAAVEKNFSLHVAN